MPIRQVLVFHVFKTKSRCRSLAAIARFAL